MPLFQESRFLARLWLVYYASLNRHFSRSLRSNPHKILIATQLLLGDCILIVSLVKKTREIYPNSEIVVALPSHAIEIYQSLDLNVKLVAWREKDLSSLRQLKAAGPYDKAFVPYEKWGPVWANAFGAREVIGFSFPRVWFHDRFLTHVLSLPDRTMPVSDWVMQLVSGPNSAQYQLVTRWQKNTGKQNSVKRVMLHIGARNQNRRWLAARWEALAETIRQKGWQVVWSYAPSEKTWANQIVKKPQDGDIGGKLAFDELLKEIAAVDAVVCPDTGVVHLCKLTATANVVIYGQGNPAIHGNGEYWQNSPVKSLFIEDVPCRDMQTIFGREIQDLRRCDRGPDRCKNPYCQNEITSEQVMQALLQLLSGT
jgi:ADP-heptose:LPS heptosyltransferase